MRTHPTLFHILYLLLFSAASCQYLDYAKRPKGEKMLAEVDNKALYLSELEGMIPMGTSSQDSIAIINEYVSRWVREMLMMTEAEQNIPKDLNIDKLVRDYRASLIRHNYEKMLIEQQLDSTLTTDQLMDFYEKHKDQYQLDKPVIRCLFIKVPRSAPDLNDLDKWWRNRTKENIEKIIQYCETNAKTHLLDPDHWYKIEYIAPELPKGTVSEDNVAKREVVVKDSEYQYYFKILEAKNKRETPPFPIVKEEASKFILHQRKQDLIEKKKQDLYTRELQSNNIKIYTN